jgi:hypothetical protein
MVGLVLLLSGCTGADEAAVVEEVAAVSGMVTTVTRVVPITHTIDWDEAQAMRPCRLDGSTPCQQPLFSTPGATVGTTWNIPEWRVTDADALFWRLAVEVSWETENPFSGQARLDVFTVTPCGDGCWKERSIETLSGPSPLVMPETDIFLEAGETGLLLRAASLASGLTAPGADIEFHGDGYARGYVPAAPPVVFSS